jgi:hypothetical protein
MPVVGVNRDALFKALGKEYSETGRTRGVHARHQLHRSCSWRAPSAITAPWFAPAAEEEFDALCFEYGIELDDVVRCFRRVPEQPGVRAGAG